MVSESLETPKFGERFAFERAPLSLAVAMEGHIEVQAPYDLHFGQDMFTEEDRRELDRLMNDFCEHWAPECKLFSRAAANSTGGWRCKAHNQ